MHPLPGRAGHTRAARGQVMHKAQYDEKRLALAEAGSVDDIYDLLAAHAHKVSTGDQARAPPAASMPLMPGNARARMILEKHWSVDGLGATLLAEHSQLHCPHSELQNMQAVLSAHATGARRP